MFLSKAESLSEKKIYLSSILPKSIQKYVKQLTQWITSSKIIFKTMKKYRNDNRKITDYFEREILLEKNDSNNNEIIVDNNTTSKNINDKSCSNILEKNKRSFRIRKKQVDGNSTTLNDNKHDNSKDMHSILQLPTINKSITETNNTKGSNNSNIPILMEQKNYYEQYKAILGKNISKNFNKNKK